jgi:hypothetical protein
MIEIKTIRDSDPYEFDVTVKEGGTETQHRVTMGAATYQRLTGGKVDPEKCVEAAFKFLLDREPKESILGTFDISVISRFFSDFREAFPNYL